MFYLRKIEMLKSMIAQVLPEWLRFSASEVQSDSKMSSANWTTASESGEVEILPLENFLQQFEGVPQESALLGICEDGLPVLMDLQDQHSFPLAILGDAGCGKTCLMQGFLESSLYWSQVSPVEFLVIAKNIAPYQRYYEKFAPSCLGLYEPDDPKAEDVLLTLTEKIDEAGISPQAITLVFMDDLAPIRTASLNFCNRLEQILREGATANIALIAAVSTPDALKLGRWLRFFRTRVLGAMSLQAASRLGLYSGLDAQRLSPNRQFAVFTQSRWLKFWTLTLA